MTKAHRPYSSTASQNPDDELYALTAELIADGFEPALALHCARELLAPLVEYATEWDAAVSIGERMSLLDTLAGL